MTRIPSTLAWASPLPLGTTLVFSTLPLSASCRRRKQTPLLPVSVRIAHACEQSPPLVDAASLPHASTEIQSAPSSISGNGISSKQSPSRVDIAPPPQSQQEAQSAPSSISGNGISRSRVKTQVPTLSSQFAAKPVPTVPQPNHKIPGPKPLPVLGNALDIVNTPLSELLLSYARQYGLFVKFSIVTDDLHLVSDPYALQHINASNAKNYLDRWTPPGFEILLYNGKLRGLVFTQRRYWMQHRQVVGQVFRSSQFLSNFVHVAEEKTNYLMDHVWGNSNGSVVNIHQAMRMLTLDIIGCAAFGTNFGAMEKGYHEIETSLANILSSVLDVVKSPLPLWRYMQTPSRAKVQQNLNRMHEIEMSLIHERRRRLQEDPESQSRSDLLAMLLKAHDSSRSPNFKDEDLMWDVHDVIFAGHETTASALAATVFLVAGSERVQQCIHEELRTVLGDGSAPRLEDLPKLRYLDMVLNEGLRLYPPTALIGRIAKEKDVVAGYEVPAGASILMSPYVMGRLDSLWDNPLEFRPERFLPENIAKRHAMTHTPFGAGPRVCLGARMATMEAKVVLAMLFSRYKFERTKDELIVDYNSTVSFKDGMEMTLKGL